MWKRYEVHKPSMPKEMDMDTDHHHNRWVVRFYPSALRLFVGKHNTDAINALQKVADDLDSNRILPGVTIIHGPAGSGKSGIAVAFAKLASQIVNVEPMNFSKWVLLGDVVLEGERSLWERISKFASSKDPKPATKEVGFKLVVVDNIDKASGGSQHELKRVMLDVTGKLKFIFVGTKITGLHQFIRNQAIFLKTAPILERDALTVILSICHRMNVGYDREGIQEMFKSNPSLNMSKLVDSVQNIFCKYYFISAENVKKIGKNKKESPIIDSSAAVMPFGRCEICTLFPPCKHRTEEILSDLGKKKRGELPVYKGGLQCPEFIRLGYCKMFNRTGHCSLSHPRTAHRLQDPRKICVQCTITWPCDHCAYSVSRKELFKMIDKIMGLIASLKYFLSAAPPQALTTLIRQKYPDYYADLKQLRLDVLGENMTTNENMIRFNNIKLWAEKTLTTEELEYKNKHKALRFLFTPLLESEILEFSGELKADMVGDVDTDPVDDNSDSHAQQRPPAPAPPAPPQV